MSPYTVHCKSCCRTYDGNAQCCVDMDHVRVESFADHLEEIRPLVESNPELLRRLDAMQKLYDDEVLTNEEVGNDLNQALVELEEKDEEGDRLLDEMCKQEEINGGIIMQLVSTNTRLRTENEELKKKIDSTVGAEEYYANVFKIQLSIKDFPRLIDMTPPIFDFERWFKDTWGRNCREGGRIPGYTLYYEEMRALKKAAGWEVLETEQFNLTGITGLWTHRGHTVSQ